MPSQSDAAVPLLECRGLCKTFQKSRIFSRRTAIHALNDVNLTISQQTTTSIVGESGSGKTTLGRCLALIEQPDSGQVLFEGRDITQGRRESNRATGKIQLIFQSTAAAMNPLFSMLQVVEEPLRIGRHLGRSERRDRAIGMIEKVGLSPEWCDARPANFSGGQHQRIAIARALLMNPKVLILDEALAGLDFASANQIIGLLADLQQSLGLSYLFITHDLRPIVRLDSRVLVMNRGNLRDTGQWQSNGPTWPYDM